jgi:ABC-type multidrug transport system permease subunit
MRRMALLWFRLYLVAYLTMFIESAMLGISAVHNGYRDDCSGMLLIVLLCSLMFHTTTDDNASEEDCLH